MIRRGLRRLLTVLQNEISGRFKRQVHYISDSSNWSFKWDAHYISKGMSCRLDNPVAVTVDPWNLRHQIVIFGNRYPWFFGPRHTLHSSNKVVVTWFHGDISDQETAMQRMFKQLPEVFARADRVVVTCDHSYNVLLGQGVAANKLVKIPLGVDLKTFVPPSKELRLQIREMLDIPNNAFCIGSFQKDGSGWEEGMEPKLLKGPDIFLASMALLKDKHPNLMVLLTGPARGYVKQGLDELGIDYRHKYFDEYLDIVPYYQALDLYLIASRGEGGPKALLEGMACGVPIVSSRVGMPADVIKQGENGFLADIEDSKSLASHIEKLIADPVLLKKCSNGGLETIKKYDWQLIADEYVEMVKKL
ncbi:MAG: glycosyltransferase family 4 protein [Magnetococcales bacterium]|nr:glycosyltransferase family 4 protein [Magnetococcales bacterium]